MAQDYISLDTCPIDEKGIQVDPNADYLPLMRVEALRYIEFLKKRFINFVKVNYKISSNSHDFGTYLDIQLRFNDENEDAVEQAFFIETNLPFTWDDETIFTYPECTL